MSALRSRNDQVHVRVTKEEHDTLRAAARATGLSLSEYGRLVLLGTPPTAILESAGITANRRQALDGALEGFRAPRREEP